MRVRWPALSAKRFGIRKLQSASYASSTGALAQCLSRIRIQRTLCRAAANRVLSPSSSASTPSRGSADNLCRIAAISVLTATDRNWPEALAACGVSIAANHRVITEYPFAYCPADCHLFDCKLLSAGITLRSPAMDRTQGARAPDYIVSVHTTVFDNRLGLGPRHTLKRCLSSQHADRVRACRPEDIADSPRHALEQDGTLLE